jgi:putative ABC transport system permease protein
MSWSRFFRRRHWDQVRTRELEIHLEIETGDNIARGMSPEEARRAAHRKLGNPTLIREEIYRINSIGFLEILWHDIRFGTRMLGKNPGFTIVAVLTLAIGIGANTAIFSVVNATLIRPLPYPNASRVVMVWETRLPDQKKQNVTSPATFLNWQEHNSVFEQIAGVFNGTAVLTGGGTPEQLAEQSATPNFFSVLGASAFMGRGFVPSQDGKPGADSVVILSFELWQRRFGSNPNILGSTITLDDKPRTVIGVMPRGFQFFVKQQSFSQKPPEVWVPLTFEAKTRVSHGRWLQAVGLLRPSITLPQAQASMTGLATRLEAEDPASMKNWGVNLVPLRTQLVGDVETGLRLLLAAVGLVLLIACANVATLFLARATARKHEIAIRMALGAAKLRVVRQILTESCLIAVLGAAAGLLLAIWSTRALKSLAPPNLIPLEGVQIDLPVLAFTGAIALLTGLLFGTVPAVQAARTAPREPLQEGGRGGVGDAHRSWARRVFVVAEIALALILLAGSGLLIRSFSRLMAVDPGFESKNILTAQVQIPDSKYKSDQQKTEFFDQLLTRLRQLPGVRSVSADAFLPFAGIIAGTGVDVEGRPVLPIAEKTVIDITLIEPQFFETMGIPVLRGRTFTDREGVELQHKVVISETMAAQLWPNEDPIGKHVTIYMKRENVPSEVIGVVGDVRHAGLDADTHPTAYWPYPELAFSFMIVVMRTDGDPMALAPALRQTVWSLDKNQPVADIHSMNDLLSASLARTRFATVIMATFAGMALLLAVLGIYGVVTYNVEERTREFGIRLALGAPRSGVLGMVLKQGIALVVVGVVIGTAAALALTRVLVSLLFGTKADDPVTFVMVVFVLSSVALAASYLAARRAIKLDPIAALRWE